MNESSDLSANSSSFERGDQPCSYGFSTLPNPTSSRQNTLSSDSFSLARRICELDDREAWTELYQRYTPYVHGYLRRWHIPQDLVEDIYHDSMASFYEAVQSGSFDLGFSDLNPETEPVSRSPHPIRPYLTTIIRNRTYSLLERIKKSPRNPEYSDWDVPELTKRELKEIEVQEWRRSVLQHCLVMVRQEFDDRVNYVFHLRTAEGKSSREVAELVETTESAVNMIVHRVKKRLQTLYPEVEGMF